VIHLLDATVLIALMVEDHPLHELAVRFFPRAQAEGWATCPITENALLRIVGSPAFPGGPGTPQAVRAQFANYLASPGHQFWADDLSMSDSQTFPVLPSAKHLTDYYLLALAVKRQCRFVTFDRKINASIVPGGTAALLVLEE
jgi:toxin-antitoxin system PIN domain toxin